MITVVLFLDKRGAMSAEEMRGGTKDKQRREGGSVTAKDPCG